MDLLETPKGFPNPELRYTICDLSLVWHMYGGSDFQSTEKKTVRIKGDAPGSVIFYKLNSEVYIMSLSLVCYEYLRGIFLLSL